MTDQQRQELVDSYNRDSSITYELAYDELFVLLGELGEMEPIIDAINVLNGASVEQRARDIGCSPSDFDVWTDPKHSQR